MQALRITLEIFPPERGDIDKLMNMRLWFRKEPRTPTQYCRPCGEIGQFGTGARGHYRFNRVQVHQFVGVSTFVSTVCENVQ
jgi:hypothetical protein